MNEGEKARLSKVYEEINKIESREHRKVSFHEELKMRGAVTIDQFEELFNDRIKEM